jgi:integrase/recombinase XerD
MKLKHIDVVGNKIYQDAREVNTKFSKTFTTDFFPVGDHLHHIANDWVRYLKEELLWGNDDPLFPKTNVIVDEGRSFKAEGLMREHWSTASLIRTIFKNAFEAADLPYYIPHSFRKTLVTLGQKICKSPEEFKAWSQNLGYDEVMTTLYSYGQVEEDRQSEIFQQLKYPRSSENQNAEDIAKAVVKEMVKQQAKIGV